MSYSPADMAKFTRLYTLNIIPLRVILGSLTWVLHDYFVTLEDEVKHIWTQQRSLAKFMFLWIRYYTLFLLVFDAMQIHLFARPGITSDVVCVAMDPVTRTLGAISLWSIEVIMQLRIYALYNRNKKIAFFNGLLFLGSITSFLWIMIHNAMKREELIASAIHLPLPGCPSINAGIQWAQWVPATIFEFILFSFALYKTARFMTLKIRMQERVSLTTVLLHDNILYFFGVGCLLIFNNLMVVGATRIPWFSFGPFHAALGIMTTRMLIHLRKCAIDPAFITKTSLSGGRGSAMIKFRVPESKGTTRTRTVGSSAFDSTLTAYDNDLENSAENIEIQPLGGEKKESATSVRNGL